MNLKFRAAWKGRRPPCAPGWTGWTGDSVTPTNPVLGRLDTPEDTPLEQVLVAGEVTLLAQAVLARLPGADLPDLTLDLSPTAAHLDAHFQRLAHLTRVQVEFASLPRQWGVPLLPDELEVAVALVLEAARAAEVALPPAWLPGHCPEPPVYGFPVASRPSCSCT